MSDSLRDTPQPHTGRFPRRHLGPRPPRVRWGALAVGSTIGIAAWATLYVWGAAAAALLSLDITTAGSAANIAMALYGGLAAGTALCLGSAAASRTANADSTQAGVLHGLTMWGMANITLIVVVGALGAGVGAGIEGPAAYVVHVGQAAVSGGAQRLGGTVQEWPLWRALVGMAAVMLSSLGLSVWGGLRGIVRA